MARPLPLFQLSKFKELWTANHLGKKIIYSEITGSTMDDARRLAHNVCEHPHGTVVMSEAQSKARGARDHKWNATNVGNIYVSFILHMPAHYKTFQGRFSLEVAACLAVLKAVNALGVKDAIPKWPNDLWVRGHKLAGFLAEDGKMDIQGSKNCLLILGLGINVNSDVRHNSELNSIATSLFCERGGKPIDREQFFADVCLYLEEALDQPSEVNFQSFVEQNLFQKDCDISVTCAAEGKVFDAAFLEICSSWEIKFSDKKTHKVLQGSSEMYTIRPKVYHKILVVFTGMQDSSSASHVARWLMSLVDSSKHSVCLVPESSITGSVDWAKTCSLLVLPECPSNPQSITTGLKSYIRSGGRLMASGLAASFVANLFEVPVKEVLMESSSLDPELGLIHLCLDKVTLASKPSSLSVDLATGEASHTILFPSDHACYQFFSSDDSIAKDSEVSGGDHVSTTSARFKVHKSKAEVVAHYAGEKANPVAVFMGSVFQKDKVALWGFDIGMSYPAILDHSSSSTGKEELKEVEDSRFDRDYLLQHVLAFVLEKPCEE